MLELAGVPRPQVCYIGTASAHKPEYLDTFYDSFRRRTCEPTHLELFGVPEDPGGADRAPGRDLRRRRQHREHARDLARARDRRRAARGVGARRGPRRLERRRELLVRGLGHRLVRPAPAGARRRPRASCRAASARTTTASPSAGRPSRGSCGGRAGAGLRRRRRRGLPVRGHGAPSRSSASAKARAATASRPRARRRIEPRLLEAK